MSPKVALQYLLPHRLLSRIAYGVARTRTTWFKDWLIKLVVRKFKVDMSEALDPVATNYLHFNAFFTRELRPGVRTADPDPSTLVMPADGKISQVGRIEAGRIFQAKGQAFTAAELLGNEALAEDLTSRTFEKAWSARARYRRDIAGFSTWLISIARNVATDHFRAQRAHVPLEAAEEVATTRTPHDDVAKDSDLARLGVLLKQLPQREQELVALKYGAEATNRAIAELTGLSESNVGTILHRVVQTLRRDW